MNRPVSALAVTKLRLKTEACQADVSGPSLPENVTIERRGPAFARGNSMSFGRASATGAVRRDFFAAFAAFAFQRVVPLRGHALRRRFLRLEDPWPHDRRGKGI